MKIDNISFRRLSNLEFHEFAKSSLDTISTYDLVTLRLDVHHTKSNTAFNDFDLVLLRDKKNPMTIKLINADDRRDDSFLVFKSYVTIQEMRQDPAIVEASKKVMAIIKLAGKELYSFNRVEETAALNNLFSELEKPEISEAITLMGATEFLNELKDAQAAYMDLIEEIKNKPIGTNLTFGNTRRPLEKSLRELFNCIEIMATIENAEPWFEIINKLNNLFSSIKKSIRDKKAKPEEEVESTEPKKGSENNPEGESNPDQDSNPDADENSNADPDVDPDVEEIITD
jgi:hypothetical protein